MSKHSFSNDPAYLQAVRGFHRLHSLTVASPDDSPEEEAVRDELDRVWYDLSETEKQRIRGLSEDLYSISDPVPETLPSNPQVQRMMFEASEARRLGHWDKALQILRRWSRYIDPPLLSFLRGSIWNEAGDVATANLFYEHSARLDPQHFQHAYLTSLSTLDVVAGQELATEILAAEDLHSAEAVISAAGLQSEAIRNQPIETCRENISRLISSLDRALLRVRRDDFTFPSLRTSVEICALVIKAGLHERLGDLSAAVKSLDEGLEADSNNGVVLMFRGVLRYGSDDGATDDLSKAASLNVPFVWPRLFLAHHALVGGQFEECLRLSERALTFPAPDQARSDLHEWIAISRSELNFPPNLVRSAFEEAIRLAPAPDRIRQNLAVFEEGLTGPEKQRPIWINPDASSLQELVSLNLPPIGLLLPAA